MEKINNRSKMIPSNLVPQKKYNKHPNKIYFTILNQIG